MLLPVWAAVQGGKLAVSSSQLSVLEVLVLPLRAGNATLVAGYDRFLMTAGVQLLPITEPILRTAARLRATVPRLKTRDSIHAASALAVGASLFLTNDLGFRNVPGLTVEVLDDTLARP